MKSYQKLIFNVILVILLGIIVSAFGVFDTTGGEPREVTNAYGDSVRLYGYGIYANDSYFKAPLFRGTDLVMLLVAVPLLIAALAGFIQQQTMRRKIFLLSTLTLFLYYSASLAFGVTYNALHLAYIALFSASLFALVQVAIAVSETSVAAHIKTRLPSKGFNAFLYFSGIVLIIAWLPDILASLAAGRPLALIEHYTTEITYVLDMGLIGPAALVTIGLVKKQKNLGYMLLSMLLMLCAVIGIMLPVQTVFQARAGIELPLPVLITKVASFCLLAVFAGYFYIRLLKSIQDRVKG